MNITLANTVEELPGGETMNIGTAVIRGNLIIALEVRTSYHTQFYFL